MRWLVLEHLVAQLFAEAIAAGKDAAAGQFAGILSFPRFPGQ